MSTYPDKIPVVRSALVTERHISYDNQLLVTGPASVCDQILREHFADKDREEFISIMLTTGGRVCGFQVVTTGGLACSIVEPRGVFRTAILANAASIIVAHNHPSGNPDPSREDIQITAQLVEAGRIIGIPVQDHIIYTTDRFTSLAERGLV